MAHVGCPGHTHTSSQGHGRSSSLLCWTCLPRGLKAWPSLPLPSQKLLFSDSLLVQLQSCAGFAARAVGTVLPFLLPRQDHEEMSCSNTRLWAEEGSPGSCFPTLGHLQKQLRVWKREESAPPKHQETASPCTLPSHAEVFQEPAEFPTDPVLPTEAEWPKKDSRSPMTAPSVPAPAALHAPLCCQRCTGV